MPCEPSTCVVLFLFLYNMFVCVNFTSYKAFFPHNLNQPQAEVASLTTANEVLRHKLEAQTQRMELAVQQAMLHGSVPVLPDVTRHHQTNGRPGTVYILVLATKHTRLSRCAGRRG